MYLPPSPSFIAVNNNTGGFRVCGDVWSCDSASVYQPLAFFKHSIIYTSAIQVLIQALPVIGWSLSVPASQLCSCTATLSNGLPMETRNGRFNIHCTCIVHCYQHLETRTQEMTCWRPAALRCNYGWKKWKLYYLHKTSIVDDTLAIQLGVTQMLFFPLEQV